MNETTFSPTLPSGGPDADAPLALASRARRTRPRSPRSPGFGKADAAAAERLNDAVQVTHETVDRRADTAATAARQSSEGDFAGGRVLRATTPLNRGR
jgi:hypothetical protein